MHLGTRILYLLFCLIGFSCIIHSQHNIHQVAKFSFNDKSDIDEITQNKIKLVGVGFTKDRFGNENNAVFLSGNPSSYINLGSGKNLKLKTGSISLWVKVENPIWSGKGHMINPFIMTKRITKNDFYESYIVCYFPETKKVAAWCSQDSLKQIGMNSIEEFSEHEWHHLVIAYNNNQFSFFIDGKLENTLTKDFETQFLEQDSVIVGVTANSKNFRYSNISVDDIEFFDQVLSQTEVANLYHAPNPNLNRIVLNWVLVVTGAIVLIIVLYLLVKTQIKRGVLKERYKLELQYKLLETELRANRASMNPHFLFNSLNALNNLILSNRIDNASDYLVRFSKLLRKILETNFNESITLEFEIELLKQYVEIENLRFEKNIKFIINVEAPLVPSAIKIPIMILQPFVENAIWHGLMNSTGDKKITLSFSLYKDKYVYCIIEDNGVGRNASQNNFIEKKSMATGFVMQRLELLNKIHHLNCTLEIHDNPENSGTSVKIIIPILNN